MTGLHDRAGLTEPAEKDRTGFDEEIRRAERCETRLAVRALIALAIVAALIAIRLAGF
jgi:hypothetical protein